MRTHGGRRRTYGSNRPAAPLIAAADALERLEMPPAEVIQKECSVGALDVCRVDCCLFRSVTSDMCVILAFCCKLGLSWKTLWKLRFYGGIVVVQRIGGC